MVNVKGSNKLFKATIAATVAAGAFVTAAPVYTKAAPEITELTDLEKEQDYYEAVKILLERGAIKGFPDLTYRPYESVTRGQAAKILAHFLDLDLKNVENPRFVDVKETDEYYTAIAALVEKGIIKGYADHTFRQNEPLTRAQMAQMVVLGFELNVEQSEVIALPFIDVDESDAFAGYIQALANYDITKGVSENQFAPNAYVTRGQMASFITRGEAALAIPEVSGEIVEVEEDKVVLSTGTYYIPESLKGIFKPENTDALQGAYVDLKKDGKVIQSLTELILVGSTDSTKELKLDGGGTEVHGNLTILGDYHLVQNLKVAGDLTIYESSPNQTYANDLVVDGETHILSKIEAEEVKAANADLATEALPFSVSVTNANATVANEEGGGTVTFTSSSLNTITASQNGVTIEVKEDTTFKDLIVEENATLNADYGYLFPSVTLSKAVTELTANVEIENLITKGEEAVTIHGDGRVDLMKAYSTAPVFIDLPGSVNILEIHNPDAKISLGRKTLVGHLYLPLLTDVKKVIANYDDIARNIEMIDGEIHEP